MVAALLANIGERQFFCFSTAVPNATMLLFLSRRPNVGHRSVHDPHHPKYVKDGNEIHDRQRTRSTTVSILRSHVSAACLMEIKSCPHRHGPTSVTMTDDQTPMTFTQSVMLCCILFAFVIHPQQRIVCWQLIKINSV